MSSIYKTLLAIILCEPVSIAEHCIEPTFSCDTVAKQMWVALAEVFGDDDLNASEKFKRNLRPLPHPKRCIVGQGNRRAFDCIQSTLRVWYY